MSALERNAQVPAPTPHKVLESPLDDEKKKALLSWLKTNAVDQKHEDAKACLALVRDTYVCPIIWLLVTHLKSLLTLAMVPSLIGAQ